jgi:hypothetical protein
LAPKRFEILRGGIPTAEEGRLVNPPGVHDCGLGFAPNTPHNWPVQSGRSQLRRGPW